MKTRRRPAFLRAAAAALSMSLSAAARAAGARYTTPSTAEEKSPASGA